MMKKIENLFLLVLLLAACDSKKADTQDDGNRADTADSVCVADTGLNLSAEISDGLTNKNVDEFFGDFIFSFIQDRRLQVERVRFPLKYVKMTAGKQITSVIEKNAWKHERIFVSPEYYTVLFNNEDQMELENSTETKVVDIEKINLKKNFIKVFHFEKVNGLWMLCQESEHPMGQSPLAEFLDFYRKFASDSLMQRKAIEDPLRFVTADPENDFGTIEGTLSVDQWFAFKPVLPENEITNIRYGQSYKNPNHIVFVKRGISNGMLDVLTFTKKDGQWKFVSYEN
jgi:hypothetical protein